jgi:hypothetical protein
MYPAAGGQPVLSRYEWKFPSGAKVSFRSIEHETDKFNFDGTEIACLELDELPHFADSQFWYLLSRNRTTCGVRPYVRATCNPDAGSWVARLIDWWIDPQSGYPIRERSGALRWFVRLEDELHWADSEEELRQRFSRETRPVMPKSLTFIPSRLEDNPSLGDDYRANLQALPRVERERLLGGNWRVTERTVIDLSWWKHYTQRGEQLTCSLGGQILICEQSSLRRFATIDTAGTSRDKAAAAKGKHSWSVVCVWDYYAPKNLLFLRHVWRKQVEWNELKSRVPEVLDAWNVPRAYLENAHSGPALKSEIRGRQVELVGPTLAGMSDSNQGAKLDRAIASGVLARIEDGLLLLPSEPLPWLPDYTREWSAWMGLPDEQSDQIDCSSYASYVSKQQTAAWGGVLNVGGLRR